MRKASRPNQNTRVEAERWWRSSGVDTTREPRHRGVSDRGSPYK